MAFFDLVHYMRKKTIEDFDRRLNAVPDAHQLTPAGVRKLTRVLTLHCAWCATLGVIWLTCKIITGLVLNVVMFPAVMLVLAVDQILINIWFVRQVRDKLSGKEEKCTEC